MIIIFTSRSIKRIKILLSFIILISVYRRDTNMIRFCDLTWIGATDNPSLALQGDAELVENM